MKNLVLVRHAKSDWGNPALNDFDRPLNRRGMKNAPLMGRRLRQMNVSPERVISSPARRARDTAQLLAAELGVAETEILFEPRIYDAGVADLVEIVRTLDDAWDQVLLVGHNPGISELASLLGDVDHGHLVTCAAVGLAFGPDTWSRAVSGGRTLFHDYPKNPGSPRP